MLSTEQIYDHKPTSHSKLLTVAESLSSFLYSLQSVREVHNEMKNTKWPAKFTLVIFIRPPKSEYDTVD